MKCFADYQLNESKSFNVMSDSNVLKLKHGKNMEAFVHVQPKKGLKFDLTFLDDSGISTGKFERGVSLHKLASLTKA